MPLMLSPADFLQSHFRFAVVEASNDSSKIGFNVYAAIRKAGYTVVPVSVREGTIQGDPTFPNLKEAQPFPDAVIFTILEREDPQHGIELLKEMRDNGLFRLWAEPGCDTYAMREFAEQNNILLSTGVSVIDQLPAVEFLSAN